MMTCSTSDSSSHQTRSYRTQRDRVVEQPTKPTEQHQETVKQNLPSAKPGSEVGFRLSWNPLLAPEGFYKGGKFVFSFKVGQGYPHDPPKVKCETMVYHPNIDLEGNVCLNILREDWKPVLTINSIIYGLQYLFLEPNPEDPLNKEAAEVLQTNRRLFEQNVHRSLRGGYVGATYFERCLK
ncbi:NEDD8-conjugating enzyme Ubc12 isoform X2 [Betta splendens]|uniref:NEDD8-conjugating enzyme UBC12 n=1 Tax=Betta splendens TaxID=158456 RepID=A0A8M1HH35_BETSP|nr:NEDD8-conjugating enzyme Ubc12 isoform X2 [Betta splendens]